jgi:hypothetical protein
VLRTRSPLIPGPKPGSPFDLHVLSAPPAFVLSQDQTLRRDSGLIRCPKAQESTVFCFGVGRLREAPRSGLSDRPLPGGRFLECQDRDTANRTSV